MVPEAVDDAVAVAVAAVAAVVASAEIIIWL